MAQSTPVPVNPWFELEDFMNHSRESRIDGQVLQKLMALWEDWSQKVSAFEVRQGNQAWLAVWLPQDVEDFIDEAWQSSPAAGYLYNCLAQYLNMTVIDALIPQISGNMCAPAPRPTTEMLEALEEAGLPYTRDSLMPLRRYAIVTHYPFKGGCEICHLRPSCPKGNNKGDFASILLPGHERGVDE